MTKKIFKKALVVILFPIWLPIACFSDTFLFWMVDNGYIFDN